MKEKEASCSTQYQDFDFEFFTLPPSYPHDHLTKSTKRYLAPECSDSEYSRPAKRQELQGGLGRDFCPDSVERQQAAGPRSNPLDLLPPLIPTLVSVLLVCSIRGAHAFLHLGDTLELGINSC